MTCDSLSEDRPCPRCTPHCKRKLRDHRSRVRTAPRPLSDRSTPETPRVRGQPRRITPFCLRAFHFAAPSSDAPAAMAGLTIVHLHLPCPAPLARHPSLLPPPVAGTLLLPRNNPPHTRVPRQPTRDSSHPGPDRPARTSEVQHRRVTNPVATAHHPRARHGDLARTESWPDRAVAASGPARRWRATTGQPAECALRGRRRRTILRTILRIG